MQLSLEDFSKSHKTNRKSLPALTNSGTRDADARDEDAQDATKKSNVHVNHEKRAEDKRKKGAHVVLSYLTRRRT